MSVVADSDGPGGEGVCRSLRLMGHDPTIRPAISFGWLDGFARMVTNHTRARTSSEDDCSSRDAHDDYCAGDRRTECVSILLKVAGITASPRLSK